MANSKRRAADADGHRRDAGTGAVEGHHRQFEALVFLAEQVLGRDLDFVEGDGRGVGRPLAHLVLLLVDADPGEVGVDDEGADPAVTGLGVGLGVDREVVGVGAVGDEALGAADDVLVALLDGRVFMPETSEPASGSVRQKEASFGAFAQHPEVLLLRLLGAAEGDRRGGEAVGHQRGADAGAAPADLLLDQAAGEVVEAGTAVGLGDVGVHQPDLPGLVDDVLGPGAVFVSSQATLRISFSAKLWASSRRSFCSSVRVKSTTGRGSF